MASPKQQIEESPCCCCIRKTKGFANEAPGSDLFDVLSRQCGPVHDDFVDVGAEVRPVDVGTTHRPAFSFTWSLSESFVVVSSVTDVSVVTSVVNVVIVVDVKSFLHLGQQAEQLLLVEFRVFCKK